MQEPGGLCLSWILLLAPSGQFMHNVTNSDTINLSDALTLGRAYNGRKSIPVGQQGHGLL